MIAVSIVFFDEYDTFTGEKNKRLVVLRRLAITEGEPFGGSFSSWPIADTFKMKCKTTVLY